MAWSMRSSRKFHPAQPRSGFANALRATGRYFVDGNGTPFLLHGTTAWSGIVNLSAANATTYLDNVQSNGFNALIVNYIDTAFGVNVPNDTSGNAPFSGTAFQSSLGAAYLANALSFISKCSDRGIQVFINPAYLGFDGGAQGWYTDTQAASNAQMTSYGQSIGAQLSAYGNIVYHLFGDYNPPSNARVDALQSGLATTDTAHPLFATHYGPDVSGYDDPTSWMSWDWIYRYGGFVQQQVLAGYNATPTMPVVLAEGWYEGENGATELDIRRQAWGAWTSGACGHFYGGRDEWGFGNGLFQVGTWQNWINNVGGVAPARVQMGHLKSFLTGRSWWLLSPDQTSTFITAGRGTITTNSYVTAAFSSDDSWGCAYLPTGSTGGAITVDRTEFSAAFNWTWYNPRTGGTSGGANGVANTGTQNFTAPDGNDWVWVGTVA